MWTAPLFLLGLLGLVLPIWLHRFARKTEQQHPFASTMFLEPSQIRRNRRQQIRYWLLLVLRILLLAALVLALAAPLWRTSSKAAGAGATLHVIVMDTSLSMHYGETWKQAQKKGEELLASVRGGDRVMLVAADHRVRVLQQAAFRDQAGVIRSAVQKLTPGASRLDYGAIMNAAGGWSVRPGERKVLHLVTDMQQSARPIRFADLQPPPGLTLDIVDVGAPQSSNLRVAQIMPAARERNVMLVRLEGDADAMAQRELIIEVNGVERGRRKVPKGASLPRLERFEISELGLGEHRLSARLEPSDALAKDDAYFTLIRQIEPKVLVVAANINGDDASYLRAALQSMLTPRFDVEVVSPTVLGARSLSNYAAVLVSDAGVLNASASQAVRRYVEGGGAALLTLGPRAQQLATVPVSSIQVAKGRARQLAANPTRVADVEASHAILREAEGWRDIKFFRYVAIAPSDDAKVLLRFASGAPLLVEQALQSGRLMTFAAPLDRDWSDLAIHPLFVRFVAEATGYLAGARANAAVATVGVALESELGRRSGGQVFDPAGKRALLLDGKEAAQRLIPEMPGYYEVRGGGRSDFIAVNLDPRESRLARWSAEDRAQWLALKPAAVGGSATSEAVAAEAATRTIPIWFWLLSLAAILAILEPLVANYHLPIQRERAA
jgi:Aerotolerance regulator N-terminal/von Willebrand factor type A domain